MTKVGENVLKNKGEKVDLEQEQMLGLGRCCSRPVSDGMAKLVGVGMGTASERDSYPPCLHDLVLHFLSW